MSSYTFKTNINCGNCVQSVTPFLNEIESIDSWRVDTENPDKILTIEQDDTDIQPIIEAVTKAGFSIEPTISS